LPTGIDAEVPPSALPDGVAALLAALPPFDELPAFVGHACTITVTGDADCGGAAGMADGVVPLVTPPPADAAGPVAPVEPVGGTTAGGVGTAGVAGAVAAPLDAGSGTIDPADDKGGNGYGRSVGAKKRLKRPVRSGG
jgi:hypothetical protein